ncbi:hypothetical protein [Nocardia nova]
MYDTDHNPEHASPVALGDDTPADIELSAAEEQAYELAHRVGSLENSLATPDSYAEYAGTDPSVTEEDYDRHHARFIANTTATLESVRADLARHLAAHRGELSTLADWPQWVAAAAPQVVTAARELTAVDVLASGCSVVVDRRAGELWVSLGPVARGAAPLASAVANGWPVIDDRPVLVAQCHPAGPGLTGMRILSGTTGEDLAAVRAGVDILRDATADPGRAAELVQLALWLGPWPVPSLDRLAKSYIETGATVQLPPAQLPLTNTDAAAPDRVGALADLFASLAEGLALGADEWIVPRYDANGAPVVPIEGTDVEARSVDTYSAAHALQSAADLLGIPGPVDIFHAECEAGIHR